MILNGGSLLALFRFELFAIKRDLTPLDIIVTIATHFGPQIRWIDVLPLVRNKYTE